MTSQTGNEEKAELLTIHIQKISSYPDVFAKAQRIVKVKQLKSEESTKSDKGEQDSGPLPVIFLMNIAVLSAI
ncbi:hypothetical protein BIY26_00670 [Brenneria goodwinii]|uniref:Uncharacterized protein n=1 Tax=Brenneria goodwinii TaxID=1109412 RepID=A0AAE8ESE3_9GAMM|nr:hypothetical protein [Brenneria goodwinii]ATA24290.1 hypothetical protein AWC36_09290 [Brenneria goodwinii]MCG8155056.1 hypothetical protein [Brenneria goodwinii]MCG8159300.1 hypothetical protein [Brenneria goodwinii]MCG8164531.1 hypothetical protein [Brenneria goodwinii]MCG8168903.1 hypothetical protein [Brenneria goodwinii]